MTVLEYSGDNSEDDTQGKHSLGSILAKSWSNRDQSIIRSLGLSVKVKIQSFSTLYHKNSEPDVTPTVFLSSDTLGFVLCFSLWKYL